MWALWWSQILNYCGKIYNNSTLMPQKLDKFLTWIQLNFQNPTKFLLFRILFCDAVGKTWVKQVDRGFWSFQFREGNGGGGGGGWQKGLPTSSSPVTSTNVGISLEIFLTLVLTILPHWSKISSLYLVPSPNYWTWTNATNEIPVKF